MIQILKLHNFRIKICCWTSLKQFTSRKLRISEIVWFKPKSSIEQHFWNIRHKALLEVKKITLFISGHNQAFKRQKDGYKVTIKISLRICIVLSWDELKVRQNILASDYEINMLCLLVAIVYYHKLLQFVKKKLTQHSYLVYLWIYKLFQSLYYVRVLLFDWSPGFAFCFTLPHLYHKLVTQ